VLLIALLALVCPPAGAEWLTSYEKALAAARRANRPILVDFEGSDWCGWCQALEREVWSQPAFKRWAAGKVILLKLHFPRRRALPAAQKKQNERLKMKYGITGFPTVLFLDLDGEVFGRSGYLRGGAEAWTKNADALLAKRPAPPTLKFAPVAAARDQAKKAGKALLVLATDGSAPAEKAADALAKDAEFARFANLVSVPVRLRTGGPNGSAAADIVWLATLRKRAGAEAAPLQVLLVDGRDGKVLLAATDVTKPATLRERIRASLPKADYAGTWLADLEEARALAARTNRAIVVLFTGSDWADPAQELEKTLLSKPLFTEYAAEHLVLVKADFLRKTPLPEDARRRIYSLAMRFGVRTVPTFIVLGPDGRRRGTLMVVPRAPTDDPMIHTPGRPERILSVLKKLAGG